ncbi:glutamate--tRNA ligase family protein [Streptomyces sp. TG1A-8]|uniref:glutamate--tRNA ligase family protein n=1 Tax=Streptomyces sp. TG1A-8 TaxID=3051385 RepID=UPI00265BCB84|nr:glutamate--tRNA ligase family protein [Streptomyces sp. TG1A-8]MDO0924961.1 glutamate--tRNA ligase family protein [Streptomyces sp. TG1A-8]
MPLPQTTPAETTATVRTTSTPSPIGPPSIGLVRAAVVDWALARHRGGQFVLRLEDTDAARGMAQYCQTSAGAGRARSGWTRPASPRSTPRACAGRAPPSTSRGWCRT